MLSAHCVVFAAIAWVGRLPNNMLATTNPLLCGSFFACGKRDHCFSQGMLLFLVHIFVFAILSNCSGFHARPVTIAQYTPPQGTGEIGDTLAVTAGIPREPDEDEEAASSIRRLIRSVQTISVQGPPSLAHRAPMEQMTNIVGQLHVPEDSPTSGRQSRSYKLTAQRKRKEQLLELLEEEQRRLLDLQSLDKQRTNEGVCVLRNIFIPPAWKKFEGSKPEVILILTQHTLVVCQWSEIYTTKAQDTS